MKAPREPKLDFATLQYPVEVSFKEDGIRCLTLPPPNQSALSVPVSRSFKSIRNRFVCNMIAQNVPAYLDGEIVLPDKSFNDTQSAVMSYGGEPQFQFRVFDCFKRPDYPFLLRWTDAKRAIRELDDHSLLTWVEQFKIHSAAELTTLHERATALGKEGLIIRSCDGIYKSGRATEREGYLWKVVTFMREEATIIGFEQMQKNCNVATDDAFGRSKRSKHAEGMVLLPKLGAFIVKNHWGTFNVSGFTQEESELFWKEQETLLWQQLTYKYKPHGSKDLPRSPIFVGFRDKDDL